MDCLQVRDRLSEYFDGELDQANSQDISQHLTSCDQCSDEFNAFSKLGVMVREIVVSGPPQDAWERIASRLNASPVKPSINSWQNNNSILIASVLALAVTVLVVIGIRTQSDKTPTHGHSHLAATTIDFSELVASSSSQRKDAVDTFVTKYEGEEVTVEAAKELLGYQLSISRSIPRGVQLVSTRVLKLPECNCEDGKCTCGPTGCNCAASVCKRADGSAFFVLEHCKSQDISFGDAIVKLAKVGNHEVQLFESPDKGIVASRLSYDRRLTVLGLKNAEEASSLVVSMN